MKAILVPVEPVIEGIHRAGYQAKGNERPKRPLNGTRIGKPASEHQSSEDETVLDPLVCPQKTEAPPENIPWLTSSRRAVLSGRSIVQRVRRCLVGHSLSPREQEQVSTFAYLV